MENQVNCEKHLCVDKPHLCFWHTIIEVNRAWNGPLNQALTLLITFIDHFTTFLSSSSTAGVLIVLEL